MNCLSLYYMKSVSTEIRYQMIYYGEIQMKKYTIKHSILFSSLLFLLFSSVTMASDTYKKPLDQGSLQQMQRDQARQEMINKINKEPNARKRKQMMDDFNKEARKYKKSKYN